MTTLTSVLAEEIENVISTFNLSCCENLWRRSSIVGYVFCVQCTLILLSNQYFGQIKNVFSRFIAKSAIFALLSISYWKVHLSKKKSIELEQDWVRRQQAREIVKVTVNLTKNVVVARFKKLENDTLVWMFVNGCTCKYKFYFCCVVSIRWSIRYKFSRVTA